MLVSIVDAPTHLYPEGPGDYIFAPLGLHSNGSAGTLGPQANSCKVIRRQPLVEARTLGPEFHIQAVRGIEKLLQKISPSTLRQNA